MKVIQKLKGVFGSRNFLTGAAILAVAGVICRLLGVVIRIPLANIVGNYGIGLYQMVFPLYALLLVVSSAGVPIAISKMVAQTSDERECRRILLNAIILLGLIGVVVSALFMIFAYQIAGLQGNRSVGIVYLAIAPSVFLVCIIAAFRGYFQGKQNMIPTATSQIIEQLVKVAAGITMAVLFIRISVVWAVFGAILAVTISEVVALLYLIFLYIRSLKKQGKKPAISKDKVKSMFSWSLMWNILRQSAPVTLMASVFPLILVIDSMVIINMLTASGTDSREATQLFGISSGAVHTVINLPAVLAISIATAIVPMCSSLLKQKKMDEMRAKMALAVKITILISIFFTLFYLAFARSIIDLLYHGAFKDYPEHLATATRLLKIESSLIFLIGISAVFTAMLQGINKARFPLIALLIGGVLKMAFQFSMLGTMGIYAVSIGNVICFLVAAILNTVFALHFIRIKKGLSVAAIRFGILTIIYGVFIIVLYNIMPVNRWWVLLSGTVAFVTYAILVALFQKFGFNILNVGNISNKTKGETKNEKSRIC